MALLTLICLLYGGFVSAAHVHKREVKDQQRQDATCLLCVDANHLAMPPSLIPTPVFLMAWWVISASIIAITNPRVASPFYDARGPPRR